MSETTGANKKQVIFTDHDDRVRYHWKNKEGEDRRIKENQQLAMEYVERVTKSKREAEAERAKDIAQYQAKIQAEREAEYAQQLDKRPRMQLFSKFRNQK